MTALTDRVSLAGALILIVWLPIPLGGNRPLFTVLLVCWALAILAILAAGRMLAAAGGTTGDALLPAAARTPAWLLALWLAWTFLQALPLPDAVLAALSGPRMAQVEHWRHLGLTPPTTLSVDPAQTIRTGLLRSAYLALFLVVLCTATSRWRQWAVVGALLAGALLQAAIILAPQTGADVDWIRQAFTGFHEPRRPLFGTFPNRNHAGALLAMAAAFSFAMTLVRALHDPDGGQAGVVPAVARFILGPAFPWLVLTVIFSGAVVFVSSRGALVALTLSVLAGTVALAVAKRRFTLLWLALAALVAPLLLVDWADLLNELERGGLAAGDRWLQWRVAGRIVLAYPLAGTGAGTYRTAFDLFRDGRLEPLIYDHAHNDYLELLVEDGAVGTAIVAGALLLALARMASALGSGPSPRRVALVSGSLLACLAMLIHASVEFVFRIPAIAAWLFVFLALGLAVADGRHGLRPGRRSHRTRSQAGVTGES